MTTEQRRAAWLLALTLTVPALVPRRGWHGSSARWSTRGQADRRGDRDHDIPEDPGLRAGRDHRREGHLQGGLRAHRRRVPLRAREGRIRDAPGRSELDRRGHRPSRVQDGACRADGRRAVVRAPASTSDAAVVAFNEGVGALKAKDYTTARAKLRGGGGRPIPSLRLAWIAWPGPSRPEALPRGGRGSGEGDRPGCRGRRARPAVALGGLPQPRRRGQDRRGAGGAREVRPALRGGEEDPQRGVALSKAGDAAGAFAKFKEALAINPPFQPSLIGLATAALKTDHAAGGGRRRRDDPEGGPRERGGHTDSLQRLLEGRGQGEDRRSVAGSGRDRARHAHEPASSSWPPPPTTPTTRSTPRSDSPRSWSSIRSTRERTTSWASSSCAKARSKSPGATSSASSSWLLAIPTPAPRRTPWCS